MTFQARASGWFCTSLSRCVGAGVLAGWIGGLVMLVALIVRSALSDMGALFPLRLIGATMRGPIALVGGAGTVAWGLSLHFLVAGLFGGLFGALLPRRASAGPALLMGTGFGFLILLLMRFGLLPLSNPTMAARLELVPVGWFVAHLIYGTGLAVTPALRRLLHHEPAGLLTRPLRDVTV